MASLIVRKDGSARYFQEGDPYQYRGRVGRESGGEFRVSLTGEDVYTGNPNPGKKITMEPRLYEAGISFSTREGGTTQRFWLGCHERDVGGWYRVAEAMRMDIDDINKRNPGKYKKVIKDMVNSLPHNRGLQKWLKRRNCSINYKVLP